MKRKLIWAEHKGTDHWQLFLQVSQNPNMYLRVTYPWGGNVTVKTEYLTKHA